MIPDIGISAGIEFDIDGSQTQDQKQTLDDAWLEWSKERTLKVPFFINAAIGTTAVEIGDGPQRGRYWSIVRMTASPAYPVGAQLPAAGSTTVSANQAGTGAATPITLTVPAVAGQTNQVSSFTVSGTGATAGSTITITLAGVQGGTQTYDYVVPAGAAVAAPTLQVTFNPPVQATGPNVAIVLTVPSFGAGNLASAAELEAQSVILAGGLDMFLFGSSGGTGMVQPVQMSSMELLWQWGFVPVGVSLLPILNTWTDYQQTVYYPEKLVFVVNAATASAISGQVQVVDRAIGYKGR